MQGTFFLKNSLFLFINLVVALNSLFFDSKRFYAATRIKITLYDIFPFIVFICLRDPLSKNFTVFQYFLFSSVAVLLCTASNYLSVFIFTEFSIASRYSLNLSLNNFWLNSFLISCSTRSQFTKAAISFSKLFWNFFT